MLLEAKIDASNRVVKISEGEKLSNEKESSSKTDIKINEVF